MTKRSRGRPPELIITDEMREQVQTLAGYGLSQDQIAQLFKNPKTGRPIGRTSLQRHFGEELKDGSLQMTATMVGHLEDHAKEGSVAAAIFYLKCRAGWKERQVVEIESKSGVLVAPAAVSPEDWITAIQTANKGKLEPGLDAEVGEA